MVVAGEPLTLELDTGAAVSVISQEEFAHLLEKRVKLETTSLELHTYTGEKVRPIGVCTVNVQYGDQEKALPLHVLAGKGPALLGRDWLKEITLQGQLLQLRAKDDLGKLLRQYETVLSPGLGRMKNIKARITLQAEHRPRFWKARPIPLARKPAVDRGLDELEKEDIVRRVDHSNWAAPIVTPSKKDGRIIICGDFKVTINPQLYIDSYLIPRIEDIFASLTGGKQFSVLDLRQAYLQMEVEDSSKEFLTVNTHRGLYQAYPMESLLPLPYGREQWTKCYKEYLGWLAI